MESLILGSSFTLHLPSSFSHLPLAFTTSTSSFSFLQNKRTCREPSPNRLKLKPIKSQINRLHFPLKSTPPNFLEPAIHVKPKSELPFMNFFVQIRKPLALVLFCIATGFVPNQMLQRPAVAAPSLAALFSSSKTSKTKNLDEKDHKFSDYTNKLLAEVSVLLERIEEVRDFKGSKDDPRVNVLLKAVGKALKGVKERKEELQDEVLGVLNGELREMRREKFELIKESENLLDMFWNAKRESENLQKKASGDGEAKKRIEGLDNEMNSADKKYSEIWEKVSEIEDNMLSKETMTFSVAIRELSFIERECEVLVEKFNWEWKMQSIERPQNFSSRVSVSEIQKELEIAKKEVLEQTILPSVLEVEDSGYLLDKSTRDFVVHIKQAFKESKELQRNQEDLLRQKLNKYGNEKRYIVQTPADEIVKGFPEVELKWMFGNKEVTVPNAVGIHLFHGWKKWREEAKAKLKQNLLENVEHGKQYVAQRQERILLDRDRVVAKTWYDDAKNRWEMDPIAVPYAVSKKLLDHARIRHDWAVMYVALKGDDKEYYVDIKEFEILFEDFGGFDGLYLKMLSYGIPTAVQLMWIPLSELNIRQQFLLITRISYRFLVGFWKLGIVSYMRNWCYNNIKNINDDIMAMIGFPIVEFILPKTIRMKLGMCWPEETYEAVGTTWYLRWQSEAEMNFKSRKRDGIQWFLWFFIRSFIYGFILFNLFRFMKRKIGRVLGFGPFRRHPNVRKLRRVQFYFKYRKNLRIRKKKKKGLIP